LRHPSIVSVYEVGQDQGVPYLVADFVDGVTLADVLTDRRPSPRKAAAWLATVAEALHYAHESGVVHRDVKTANIMLDEKGTPRVMDFGLAKRDAGEVTMTIEGQVLVQVQATFFHFVGCLLGGSVCWRCWCCEQP
jgi:serine/threonine-protein kinase